MKAGATPNEQMLLSGANVLEEVIDSCGWRDRVTFSFYLAPERVARSRFADR